MRIYAASFHAKTTQDSKDLQHSQTLRKCSDWQVRVEEGARAALQFDKEADRTKQYVYNRPSWLPTKHRWVSASSRHIVIH